MSLQVRVSDVHRIINMFKFGASARSEVTQQMSQDTPRLAATPKFPQTFLVWKGLRDSAAGGQQSLDPYRPRFGHMKAKICRGTVAPVQHVRERKHLP